MLPSGRWGGVAFGVLHLVVAATRIDPLRPDNPDFDLVGPGWLAMTAFGLAAVLHGIAVVAIANRYSHGFSAMADHRAARRRVALPVALPALFLVLTILPFVVVLAGLGMTVAISRIGPVVDAVRSRRVDLLGRIVVVGVVLALLPGTATDLRDVVVRDDPVASSASDAGG